MREVMQNILIPEGNKVESIPPTSAHNFGRSNGDVIRYWRIPLLRKRSKVIRYAHKPPYSSQE